MSPRMFALGLILVTLVPGARGGTVEKPTPPIGRKSFPVREVRGTVLAWEPWQSKWVAVASHSTLLENTLVQVSKSASFSFEVSTRSGFSGLRSETELVTLNTPMVIRLDDDVMRRVALNTYFMPKRSSAKDGLKDQLYEKLADAWSRIAVLLFKPGVDFSMLLHQKELDTSVAIRSKRIRIYTPPDNTTAFADRLPTELRIAWRRAPEPGVTYELRVWRSDENRPAIPTAITQLDFHNVTLLSEGGFFMQISSTDGKWQSEVYRFYVTLPMHGRLADKDIASGRKRPLTLSLPPRNFVYAPARFPTSLTFQWDNLTPPPPHIVYEIIVTDAKGKELLRGKTAERRDFETKFNLPGKYHWKVTATAPPAPRSTLPPTQFASETWTFELSGAAPEPNDPIADMLLARTSGVLFLENGL